MKIIRYPEHGVCNDSWTFGIASSRYHEFVPGTPYERWGFALLFYRSERRLSLSIWAASWRGIGGMSHSFRIFGPRKLSWER